MILADKDLIDEHGELQMAALSSLARNDPAAAKAYIDSEEMEDWQRGQMHMALAVRAFANDPQEGIDLLREIYADDDASMYTPFESMSILLSDENARSAVWQALETEQDAEFAEKLGASLVLAEFTQGGVEAARAALDRVPFDDEEVREDFVSEVIEGIGSTHPAEAIDWTLDAVSADMQADTVSGIIRDWAHRDFNAAGAYLGEMEPSTMRDVAARDFATAIVRQDPEAAATWANDIGDEESRQATLRTVLRQWNARDTEAAGEWISRNGISADFLTEPEPVPEGAIPTELNRAIELVE